MKFPSQEVSVSGPLIETARSPPWITLWANIKCAAPRPPFRGAHNHIRFVVDEQVESELDAVRTVVRCEFCRRDVSIAVANLDGRMIVFEVVAEDLVVVAEEAQPERKKPRSKLRASWRGQLRFGLVSFEVQAVNAENKQQAEVHFHLLHEPDHERIHCVKICPKHGEVANDEIKRNDRVVAVAQESHDHKDLRTIKNSLSNLLKEVESFFESYHATQGKKFNLLATRRPKRAITAIKRTRKAS